MLMFSQVIKILYLKTILKCNKYNAAEEKSLAAFVVNRKNMAMSGGQKALAMLVYNKSVTKKFTILNGYKITKEREILI